ncbi:MAG TPA: outer membrane protein assembly factor BamD, partial [Bryobacteraceae bacterium]|nr:outer membrane protein assembly factor BamD [Bryobacteraceae bacterium]
LAIADSWYREGGSHGLAQAEIEYKDFILLYPTMEEAAEAQHRVCMIHYKQMEKPDRDAQQELRAEDECRTLLTQFPNSKYAKEGEQRLRNIQEAIAEGEFRTGYFYYKKGSNPAAANRFQRLVDQYPLYSRSDEALWMLGDAYSRMGNRFRGKAGDAYARIVKDYPLSGYADDAATKLKNLELPVPKADPAALARMQYDKDHPVHVGMLSKTLGFMKQGPDTSHAAQTGAPAMTSIQPTIPASVPLPAGTVPGFSGDVTASTVSGPSALDTEKDARLGGPPASGAPDTSNANVSGKNASSGNTAQSTEAPQQAQGAAAPQTPQQEPLPTNHQLIQKKKKKAKKNSQDVVPSSAAKAAQPNAPADPQPQSK